MLIVGRAVAGLGGSGLLNGGYTIVHASVPLHKQPLYLGILVGICQIGLLSGPLVGGALTEYASWRWCFYINLPCGAVVGVLLFLVKVPDMGNKKAERKGIANTLAKLDLLGFSLFAPAAIQFILALQWGGVKYAWGSATIIGLFCGAFGTLLVFLAWENHVGDDAMIPFSVIKRRVVWCSCLNYGCLMGSILSSTYYLPIYFQAVRNATPIISGVDILPTILSTMIAGIVAGVLVGRIGYYLPFAITSAALNAIGSGLMTMFTPTTSVGVWIGYQIIQGAGRGLGFQMPIIAVQNNSPREQVSIVNALVVFSQNFGGVIFLALAQVIFSDRLRHELVAHAPQVNAQSVIVAGATGFRDIVPAPSLPGVLLAYSEAYSHVMYLTTGAACGAFIFAFGMGWKSIKKAKVVEVESDETV
ncbi:major facilitator superfamily transporter [Phlyctema vagabunda]|uniref:Major facilitator superfamily transporter n=1 Tax=Phlyctema vagabunda TaxID=108571 RepID=A0ABR4PRY7_9HELO